ncbi:MAG: SAF domain-containing protein [Candidatus Nanopelagicales bacterium]
MSSNAAMSNSTSRSKQSHDAMSSSNLNSAPALRARASSRLKDPKLAMGVALITFSMILGAWIVGSADQRTPVWGLKSPLASGSVLTNDDLVELPISVDNIQAYVASEQSIEGMRLTRDLGANELVPAAALSDITDSSRFVTIPVGREHGAALAARGDRVDVHVSERDAAGGIRASKVILANAVISEVSPEETSNGEIPVVLSVSPDQVPALVGALRGGVLDIVKVAS